MTTRRDFLKAGTAAVTTGIVFCSCGVLQSAHAQQPVRQKLPVMVGGKRVKTIDVHAHCHFREAGALLGADAATAQLPPVNNAAEAFIEIDKRLAAMDAQAIDLEVLSINPYWYNRERDLAAALETERAAYQVAAREGDFDTALVWAGEVVDLIKSVEGAAALVAQISGEAETQLRTGAKLVR